MILNCLRNSMFLELPGQYFFYIISFLSIIINKAVLFLLLFLIFVVRVLPGYPSPDNCKKEPTVQDHHKDESHDSPLRVTSQIGASAEEIKLNADNINEKGFMTASSAVDFPTELLETDGRQLDHSEITRNDQGCGGDVSALILETERAEEIELNIDNINEQRFMTISSAEGIPVEQVETNVRQLDHAEITRNDQCCAAKEIELNTDKINEQRFMTTSSAVDIPVDQLETNGRQLDHVEITRNDPCADRSIAGNPKNKLIAGNPKNKLLILDVNGLLADFVSSSRYKEIEPDFVLRGRKVYKRPFCDDFLQFCFDRFHVGVWSSRAKSNVDEAITFLMGKSAAKLLFCWNQSHCTRTKFTTVENKDKPLVLKELRKLWDKDDPDLPWEKGEFNESNTLLLDDSPYKALMNPMHSAIFPFSYRYYHTTDSELGPGGDLRVYLEGLATAENVQKYVSENPFGQRPIRETNPSWRYYRRVIEDVKRSQMWGLHHSGRR
ncbi:hypothetical protein VNO78_02760 [Psophocarpus tetragonolobus]|uniref:Mitochondrial import inner membrane translocase subunit TIM50 n=1 Tax=Psophocarpus tetragonolobus TaxID=3891 RepID=A0AAN9SZ72_PSOTE